MSFLYLDNNATTRVDDSVMHSMVPYFVEQYANPSGLYKPGREAKAAIEEARQRVAGLLGALASEVIFMGCGTEADNTALWSAIKCQPHKRHLVVSSCEHPAVSKIADQLKDLGYMVTKVLPDPSGVIRPEILKGALRPDTALVSVMAANNETGVINPIYEIGQIVKSNGSLYHIDATQAVGKIPINFHRSGADYMVCSAHKFHGPKGVGILLVRSESCYSPLLLGGSQENKCRAGTENVPGIVGSGVACILARQNLPLMARELTPIRDWLQTNIKTIMQNDVLILGEHAPRTPNTLMVAIRNANSRRLQEFMSEKDIAVGTGSACSCLNQPTPSDTILSMGVPEEFQRGTLRISLSRYNMPQYGGGVEQLAPFLEQLAFWYQTQKRLKR